jgi:hypothetical protein
MTSGGFLLLIAAPFSLAVGCGSSNGTAPGGGGGNACAAPPAVDGANLLAECSSCTSTGSCQPSAPLDACCTWVPESPDPLADGIGLHRYSTSDPNAKPDLSCLAQPATLGTPQMVTLTGYVWLFSSGLDSTGVKVEVYTEKNPNTDGTLGDLVGADTTDSTRPTYPGDTSWNSKCTPMCSFRQYTIKNVPTETPLVIKTSDGGSGSWATLYDYDIYFPTSAVQSDTVAYDATAVAGADLSTVAGTVGETIQPNAGLLAGEVHDCKDIRLGGATVGTTVTTGNQVLYFTSDEGNPLPTNSASDTSDLGLFGALNLPTGQPVRITATGQCPAGAPSSVCRPGDNVMLGTYVVQLYPGAVTAISLRGRRPWQR